MYLRDTFLPLISTQVHCIPWLPMLSPPPKPWLVPVGAVIPASEQNFPAGHSWHSVMLVRPLCGLYVPTGHLWCIALVVPTGQ